MTREEKAYCLGQEYFPNKNNVWARPNFEAQFVSEACIKMAKWERKRIIDKACIFIRQNIDLYAMDTVDARTMKHKIVLMTDFEKVFRKAMEE